MRSNVPSGDVTLPRPTTITDSVVGDLRAAILRGEYAQGEHLRQARLARRYGVSRIPLRDALACLERDGLVEIDQLRNARIVRLDADDVREIYAIRILLEPVAGRMSIERLTSPDIMRLIQLSEVMDAQATDSVLGPATRREFYEEFYRLSAMPRMQEVIMRMRDAITIFHMQVPAADDSHEKMRSFIRNRDADGIQNYLKVHLETSRDDLLTRHP